VPTPHRTGIYSIRRSVITALYSHTDLKELSIRRFLRWAEGEYGLGIMPRYVKTPVSVTDAEVIGKHPFVVRWRDMLEFLPYLSQYNQVCNMFKLIQG
jgi:hypothetical protein